MFGESWDDNQVGVRAIYRDHPKLINRNHFNGFRVVVAPFSD